MGMNMFVKLFFFFRRQRLFCKPFHSHVSPLEKTTVFQVILNNNISDSIEDKLNVLGVSGTSEMGVDLLGVLFLVQVLKLGLDVTGSFIKLVGSWQATVRKT